MRKIILSVDELEQETEINMNNIPKLLQEKNILIKMEEGFKNSQDNNDFNNNYNTGINDRINNVINRVVNDDINDEINDGNESNASSSEKNNIKKRLTPYNSLKKFLPEDNNEDTYHSEDENLITLTENIKIKDLSVEELKVYQIIIGTGGNGISLNELKNQIGITGTALQKIRKRF